MRHSERHPPTLAIWLLERFAHSVTKEALIGDLIEKFFQGRSRLWFWKQAVVAIAASALNDLGQHWPAIFYALAAPVINLFLWRMFSAARPSIPWWTLPWPWSQLVFEHAPAAVLPIAALPILAAALMISGAFRWVSLFKTLMFGLVLSAAAHLLLRAIAVPPEIHWPRTDPWVLAAAALNVSILSVTFLLSAWLGCSSPMKRSQHGGADQLLRTP
jgi:hypothetical protein